MHRILLTSIVVLTSSPAWAAGSGPLRTTPRVPVETSSQALERLPDPVATAAKAYIDECQANGASPSPTDGFVATVDLNEDSEPDYIVDTNELNEPCFCGSGGCAIQAWASGPQGYSKAFESNVRGWQLSPRDRLPPVLIVDLHGTACGGVGVDLCLKALVYRDGKLTDTTVEP